jgi:tight adherence protein B
MPWKSRTIDAGQRRKQLQRTLQDQEKKKRRAAFDVGAKLRHAGFKCDAKTFWMICAAITLVVVVLCFVVHLKPWTALLTGFVAGVGVPLWWLGGRVKKRTARFVSAFADAVDVIVRGLRSGLPLHDCFKVIAKEAPEPVAGEFQRLVENLAMGLAMDQALDKLTDRMPAPELRFFTIVLNIQQKSGGNLGEALGNLSTVLRSRRMMREKVKALSSEAVSSAGVIACLPPGVCLLVTMTNPQYMMPLFFDPRGHMLLMIAAGMMSFGVFVMRKMINFKF